MQNYIMQFNIGKEGKIIFIKRKFILKHNENRKNL